MLIGRSDLAMNIAKQGLVPRSEVFGKVLLISRFPFASLLVLILFLATFSASKRSSEEAFE